MTQALVRARFLPLLQQVRLLVLRFLLALLLYSLCRGIFYLYNQDLLEVSSAGSLWGMFVGGLRFDLSAVCYTLLPLTLLSLLPVRWAYGRGYQLVLRWLYLVVMSLSLVLNLGDVVYFRFTLKRTTMAVLGEFANENPFQFLHFFSDYWGVTLLGLALILGLGWIDRSLPRPKPLAKEGLSWWTYLVSAGLLVGALYLSIVGGRGGFGLTTRPISMSNAALYIERPQQRALVLNTPFCLLRTLGKAELPDWRFLPAQEARRYFDEIYQPGQTSVSGTFEGRNIVLIIWESLGREFVGGLNRDLPNYTSYTPFVDSLLGESYVFEQAYANAQQSVDAMPAILSSILRPNSPLITSVYASNRLPSLPARLDSMGYTTAFFHGAPNGSMGFDALVRQLGVRHYFGKTEYGDDRDFDGFWGIWDEHFLQYMVRELGKLREPFFATEFTLSSHDPYQVPQQYQRQLPKGKVPIQQAIAYTDLSLRKFFDTAKTQPWYQNTLFVLVADHSVRGEREEYKTSAGFFRIPILLFDPQGKLTGRMSQTVQQADLYPTLLDLVGDKRPMIAFGSSVFDAAKPRFAVNYLDGFYQLIEDGWLLQFDGEKVLGLYDLRSDPQQRHDLQGKPMTPEARMLLRLKAYLQSYAHRMRTDRLTDTRELD